MKPQAWAIVVLAVTTAGCAVSPGESLRTEKNPSSNYAAKASVNRQHVLLAANNGAPASPGESLRTDDPAGPVADDDFDLLEAELDEQAVEVADPLEPVNRIMYGVNDILHDWVLKPVSQAYKGVIPQPARLGIRNFFHNLTTPVRLANCLLQGKGDAAGTEFNRFVVNTTVGVLGFGDPAQDQFGLQPAAEDLGQTLATHGLGNGFYIVWPLLGPSTIRDSVGMAGDLFLNPVCYVEHTETAIGISTVSFTNESSFHIGEYEAFRSAALDPYVAMRQAYIQYRNKKIQE